MILWLPFLLLYLAVVGLIVWLFHKNKQGRQRDNTEEVLFSLSRAKNKQWKAFDRHLKQSLKEKSIKLL